MVSSIYSRNALGSASCCEHVYTYSGGLFLIDGAATPLICCAGAQTKEHVPGTELLFKHAAAPGHLKQAPLVQTALHMPTYNAAQATTETFVGCVLRILDPPSPSHVHNASLLTQF